MLQNNVDRARVERDVYPLQNRRRRYSSGLAHSDVIRHAVHVLNDAVEKAAQVRVFIGDFL
jgi:hypothetical protein